MADQVFGEILGVFDGTVQEARLPSAEERASERIHPGSVDHAAVMAEMTGGIEHGEVDP